MRCPVCQTEFSPDETEVMPFCSPRCKSIDLGRWLDEDYALPHAPDPEDDEIPDDNWSQEDVPKPEEETN